MKLWHTILAHVIGVLIALSVVTGLVLVVVWFVAKTVKVFW